MELNNSKNSIELPIIDISPWLSDDDEATEDSTTSSENSTKNNQRLATVEKVKQACETVGFFVIAIRTSLECKSEKTITNRFCVDGLLYSFAGNHRDNNTVDVEHVDLSLVEGQNKTHLFQTRIKRPEMLLLQRRYRVELVPYLTRLVLSSRSIETSISFLRGQE